MKFSNVPVVYHKVRCKRQCSIEIFDGDGRRAESFDRKKAWPSINPSASLIQLNSVISSFIVRRLRFRCVGLIVCQAAELQFL
jgi:hypothetical protein